MKNFLDTFFIVSLFVIAGALLLYMPRISYFFTAFKKHKRYKNDRKNRFAVIVPARDESKIIEGCLKSLKKQTYDENLIDIYVVVNDSKDKTIKIAGGFDNVATMVVKDQKCKGDALDGCLKVILEKSPDKYDAYLIVDADNFATENLIEEFNNALASGRQVFNAKKLIKNWQSKDMRKFRTFVSNCTSLTWANIDDMGNSYRSRHDRPINTIGTGLMVRADVIKDLNGWPFKCITEDYELMMECIMKGYTSLYYPYARVYTEEALEHSMANKRRIRWIKGYAQCSKKYKKEIKLKGAGDKALKRRSTEFLYGILPLVVLLVALLVPIVFYFILMCFYFVTGKGLAMQSLKFFLADFILIYTLFFIYTFISMMVVRREMHITFGEKLKMLFFNPLFLSEYIYIFINAYLTTDKMVWEQVERIPFEVEDFEEEEKYV